MVHPITRRKLLSVWEKIKWFGSSLKRIICNFIRIVIYKYQGEDLKYSVRDFIEFMCKFNLFGLFASLQGNYGRERRQNRFVEFWVVWRLISVLLLFFFLKYLTPLLLPFPWEIIWIITLPLSALLIMKGALWPSLLLVFWPFIRLYPLILLILGIYILLFEIFPKVYNILLFSRISDDRLGDPTRSFILLLINYFEIAVFFAIAYDGMVANFDVGITLHAFQASFGYMTSFQRSYIEPLTTLGLSITLVQTMIGWFMNILILAGVLGRVMSKK